MEKNIGIQSLESQDNIKLIYFEGILNTAEIPVSNENDLYIISNIFLI